MLKIILWIIAGIAALMLFMCAPSIKRRRARVWKGTLFAHRGLYGEGISENSLPAFENACASGYGIELDVQFTSDKQLVVFHDDDLARMTGDTRLVRDVTLSELRSLKLAPGGETIPTFDEVLQTVAGRAPLLVEIKTSPDIKALTRATVDRLKHYTGPFVVESFNPLCLMHLHHMAPDMIRGQLVCRYHDTLDAAGVVKAFALSSLLMNMLSRPDFIAYSADMPVFPAMWLHRYIFRTPLAAWTITDSETVHALSAKGEMPIFEHTRP